MKYQIIITKGSLKGFTALVSRSLTVTTDKYNRLKNQGHNVEILREQDNEA